MNTRYFELLPIDVWVYTYLIIYIVSDEIPNSLTQNGNRDAQLQSGLCVILYISSTLKDAEARCSSFGVGVSG